MEQLGREVTEWFTGPNRINNILTLIAIIAAIVAAIFEPREVKNSIVGFIGGIIQLGLDIINMLVIASLVGGLLLFLVRLTQSWGWGLITFGIILIAYFAVDRSYNSRLAWLVAGFLLLSVYWLTQSDDGKSLTLTISNIYTKSLLQGRIVFTTTKNGKSEIHIINANGSSPRNLTPPEASDLQPDWSPDGGSIAFVRSSEGVGNRDIWLMNADGTNRRPFAYGYNDEIDPAWSPDGSRIAYASGSPSNHIIVIANIVGGELSYLLGSLDSSANSRYPVWSPDGQYIAFVSRSNNRSKYQLYTMNVDGTDMQPITKGGIETWSPAWSPDGQRLAYIAYSVATKSDDIWLASVATTRPLTPLTETPDANETDIAWSPSGAFIIFSANFKDKNGRYEVYAMKTDRTNRAFQITDNFADAFHPDWWASLDLTPTPK